MQDELVELTVIVNSPIQLSCEVSGQPPPVITWTKTGQPLEPDALASQDLQLLSNGALRINRARSEDAGLYECFATSVAGNASKHVRLTVQGTVSFQSAHSKYVFPLQGLQITRPYRFSSSRRKNNDNNNNNKSNATICIALYHSRCRRNIH